MKRIAAALLALGILCTVPVQAVGTSACCAILVDGETGRVLYAQNAQEQRLIASTTKLMTALVAVETHPDLSEVVTIRPEWTGAEGSSMYLRSGEQVSLEGLLYGLLLASGNDAALAVAGHCGGSVEEFVELMNRRSRQLDMRDTHFANPNGLDDPAHYSTAADMAKLARACMEREELARIVATKSIAIAGRSFTNHNKLLWRYEGCIGMKTGYTKQAGRTLVSCAQRGGQRLIAVTLNDPDDWRDHAALFDYGFQTYSRNVLVLGGREVRRVPVSGSLNRFVPVCTAGDVYYPLSAEEQVRAEIFLPETVQAPVQAGTVAGRMAFYLEEQMIGETDLLYAAGAADDRAKAGGLDRLLDFLTGGL